MRWLLFVILSALSLPLMAAEENSSCHIKVESKAQIKGSNYLKKYEIASVSKVMTSQWAVRILGVNHRYQTHIQVLPVNSDTVDVHIMGGGDPYFNAWQFQYLVSELNKKQVTKVRTLSFDENFKFKIENRDYNTSAKIDWKPGDPSPGFIKSQLEKMVKNLHFNYELFRNRVRVAESIILPSRLKLSVGEVKFVPASDYGATSQPKSFVMESLPLHELLKEMNRNSNNYAANIIFENLGGAKAYAQYLRSMGLGPSSIEFINGSGDSLIDQDGNANYNRASCAAILTIVARLYTDVIKQGMSIMDILAVAGNNSAAGEGSTLGRYSNELTRNSLSAKTGTVCPAITLGGSFESKQGTVFFAYLYRTKWCNTSDQGQARTKINQSLVNLIASYGGPVRNSQYRTPIYSQVDSQSSLREITEFELR